MNNMITRAISGLVFVVLLISLILLNRYTLFGLLLVLMLFCIYEFKNLVKLKNNWIYVSSISLLLTVSSPIINFEKSETIFRSIFFISLFIPLLQHLFSEKNIQDVLGKYFLTIVYIAIPFCSLMLIPFVNLGIDSNETFIPELVLGLFILIWSNDTFAYLVGRTFGKHKLFERVSPKKTIEGFLGGFIFTIIAGIILSYSFDTINVFHWIVISIITSFTGVLGDLIESKFKREANIKDSSNFIPGHGGFLDRLDSIIFTAPFIYIYLQIF
ncbi:phosphatidate cytidylyltransferase [Aureivirga sp. CE67]|uniref:phosphatidate cytidylyltransferase n=1 Tax=Aureivirga sp. CE67 TaxID=1788983 RepID=UPI0018C8F50A|nr:phosphatidate cytidylyltransferase [Aureivirga sp. CE67]